ncbi:MAG: hypothetical protein AB1405_06475 [Bdellovibrionota bacterium]
MKKAALSKKKTARKKKVRRNPATPSIEAAFYRIGDFVEFEYADASGAEKRFVFNERPILCADSSGKLRVVYGAGKTSAKVPASIQKLHEVFNGYPVRETIAGVFGKKIPGSQAMGVLKAVVYHSDKRIDEESRSSPGDYRHAFEAPLPKVFVNPAGLLLIEGGSYEIGRPGILH